MISLRAKLQLALFAMAHLLHSRDGESVLEVGMALGEVSGR